MGEGGSVCERFLLFPFDFLPVFKLSTSTMSLAAIVSSSSQRATRQHGGTRHTCALGGFACESCMSASAVHMPTCQSVRAFKAHQVYKCHCRDCGFGGGGRWPSGGYTAWGPQICIPVSFLTLNYSPCRDCCHGRGGGAIERLQGMSFESFVLSPLQPLDQSFPLQRSR